MYTTSEYGKRDGTVGEGTKRAFRILEEFKAKYGILFSKYEEQLKQAEMVDDIAVFSAGVEIGLIWYPKFFDTEKDPFGDDLEKFINLFMCMYEWSKFKVAYNYPYKELRRVEDIYNLRFKEEHIIDLPFFCFFLEYNGDWGIDGILVNIRQVPVRDTAAKTFQVDAIVLPGDYEGIDLSVDNISFKLSEGDRYGDLVPYWDTESSPIDYYEQRNAELRYYIVTMFFLLTKIVKEQRKDVSKNNSSGLRDGVVSEQGWDDDFRVVYDDLDENDSNSGAPKERDDMNNSEYENAEMKRKTKKERHIRSPKPHPVRRHVQGYWVGSGPDKHKEYRRKDAYQTGKNSKKNNLPVTEHQKK